MTGDELDPKTRKRFDDQTHDCDVWTRAGFRNDWVCPDCGQTWFYASLGTGVGWYRP